VTPESLSVLGSVVAFALSVALLLLHAQRWDWHDQVSRLIMGLAAMLASLIGLGILRYVTKSDPAHGWFAWLRSVMFVIELPGWLGWMIWVMLDVRADAGRLKSGTRHERGASMGQHNAYDDPENAHEEPAQESEAETTATPVVQPEDAPDGHRERAEAGE